MEVQPGTGAEVANQLGVAGVARNFLVAKADSRPKKEHPHRLVVRQPNERVFQAPRAPRQREAAVVIQEGALVLQEGAERC